MWSASLEEVRAGKAYSFSPSFELQLRESMRDVHDHRVLGPGAVCDLVVFCGFTALWWLDFMKRYSSRPWESWRVYWVIVRFHNIPVWVAERGGIQFVDRMLHVTIRDQRELARRWANGCCDTMFDGPGLGITEWLQTRLPLFDVSHPDEWYETESDDDHRYEPWEIYSDTTRWSSSDGYSLERSDCDEDEWESAWDADSVTPSMIEPHGRFYRVRIDEDSDDESYDDLDRKLFELRGSELYDDSDNPMFTNGAERIAGYVPCALGLDRVGKSARFVTSNQVKENLATENTTSIVQAWTLKRTLMGVIAFYLCFMLVGSAVLYYTLPAGMINCCLVRPIIEVETLTGLRDKSVGLYGAWFANSTNQVEDYVCAIDTGLETYMCNDAHKLARSFHFLGMNKSRQEYAARFVMGNGEECKCEPIKATLEAVSDTKEKVRGLVDEFGLISTIGMAFSSLLGMLKSLFASWSGARHIRNYGIALFSALFEFLSWTGQWGLKSCAAVWRWIRHTEAKTAGAVAMAVVATSCAARLTFYGSNFSISGLGFCSEDDTLYYPRGQKVNIRYLPCASNFRGEATKVPDRVISFWTKVDNCAVPIGFGYAVAGGILMCRHQAKGEKSMEELHAAGFPLFAGRAELSVNTVQHTRFPVILPS